MALAHRPFVWPEIEIHQHAQPHGAKFVIRVRLQNDGPGVAFDVSASVAPQRTPHLIRGPGRRKVFDGYSTPPIRAIRSGETNPSREREAAPLWNLQVDTIEPPWWVVVRYTDAGGARWEFSEPGGETTLSRPPRRLRRRRLELWRRRRLW